MGFRSIKPLHKPKEIPEIFITFDTEAYRYPKVLYSMGKPVDLETQDFAIGDAYDGNEHFTFYRWKDFFDYIEAYPNNKVLYIIAHNAIYDARIEDTAKNSILRSILVDGGIGTYRRNERLMLENVIWVEMRRRKRIRKKITKQKLIFIDSFQFLHSALSELAKDFTSNGEKYATLEDYSQAPNEWNAYIAKNGYALVRRDTEILYEVMSNFFSLLRQYSIPFGYSLASSAFALFRSKMLDRELIFPDDEEYTKNVMEAYRGGFCNVLELGKFETIWDYDVNSLYSTAMKGKRIPTSFRRQVDGEISLSQFLKLRKSYYIIANVEFEIPDRVSFIVKKLKGKLFSLRSGTLWMHESEIIYLIQRGAYIKISQAYLYNFKTDLFDGYVDFWYNMKQQADRDGHKALRAVAKLYQNSLYGKFGQHKRHSEIVVNNIQRETKEVRRYVIWEGNKKILMSNYGFFSTYLKEESIVYSPEIAGAITANARMILMNYVLLADVDNVVYCDTDSLHCKKPILESYVSDDIGMVKLENSKVRSYPMTGEYYAPKVYRLNEEWTFKGINPMKDEKLTNTLWITQRFSKLKSEFAGITVQKIIKENKFNNDKFRYVNNVAYSLDESEIMEVKK